MEFTNEFDINDLSFLGTDLDQFTFDNMIQFEQDDFDPKFRSIQAADPHAVLSFGPPIYTKYEPVQGPPSLRKDRHQAPPFHDITSLKAENNIHIQVENQSQKITVPEKPFYLGPSQFITTLCLTELVSRIDQQLAMFFEASYNFFPDHCRWEIVTLSGSSRSKFEICIFQEDLKSFLVEGNRLSGESAPFHNFYDKVKCSLTNSEPQQRARPIPLPAAEQIPMEEAVSAMKPILSMAISLHLDARVEAVKMICDLSVQMDLQSSLCAAGAIEILMELITVDYGCCNQFAMCALANLSSSRSCQEILLKGGSQFLQVLFGMITDGPYHTAEMRRECARTLANLCRNHSKKIISTVGMDGVSSWISSVDSLKDERLKLHARRAQMNMEACM